MSSEININWLKESLDFLADLYYVKKENNIHELAIKATILIKERAHAKAAIFIRQEDTITVRVLHSTREEYFSHLLAPAEIKKVIEKKEILFNEEDFVFIPIDENGFRGAFILAIDAAYKSDKDFLQFLDYSWFGLREVGFRIQNYYSIEELTIRFNAILETIPEGIVFVDDKGKNGWVNNAAAGILNIKKDHNEPLVIANAMQQLRASAVNTEEITREGIKLFSSPNQTIKDWKWIFGDPVHTVLSVSCAPTISQNISGRLWVFVDVTSLHLANEQLYTLNIELAEKRKIADDQNKSKSDFLANMSHEIRTPMNGVIGMASLLVNTNLTDEQMEYVETIRISGEALLSIINDILDFSKIESGKMELENHPFYINTVIEETYDLLSVKANEKGLDLLYSIDPDVPAEINGDVTRLRQILVNLVSNGIKFTETGEILVTIKNTGLNKNGIYNLEFAVRDTGIGIPKNKYYKLFGSFSQLDTSTTRKYGGTGLGLAISQRLVRLMAGDITVESEEGKGTAFIFNIRVAANREIKQYSQKSKVEKQDIQGKKIAILDDNKTNLKILKKQCEMWGMTADTFDNYETMLSALQVKHYDLAIVDMVMPEKDGIEVAREIKKVISNLPVILFSSAGHLQLNHEKDKDLFAAVLNKPTKHSQLKKAISTVLDTPVIQNPSKINTQDEQEVLSINILIAEDVEINQKLLKRTLEKLGYTSDAVSNGKEAVEAVEHKKYHLIFMDVMMPEMDGYEATRIISEKYDDKLRPLIIALTANAMAEDRELAITSGMNDYISKPFKIQDIREVIEKWKPKLHEIYEG